MIFLLQVVYAAMGIGSVLLDYFIIEAFHPDIHQDVYHYMAEYMEIAELVVILMLVAIGIFVEMGGIKTLRAKTTWEWAIHAFMTISALETLARLVAMTILSIHVQPGKIDFMGLFVVIILFYFVLKFTVVLAHSSGLYDKIESIKPPKEYTYQAMPVYALANMQ